MLIPTNAAPSTTSALLSLVNAAGFANRTDASPASAAIPALALPIELIEVASNAVPPAYALLDKKDRIGVAVNAPTISILKFGQYCIFLFMLYPSGNEVVLHFTECKT